MHPSLLSSPWYHLNLTTPLFSFLSPQDRHRAATTSIVVPSSSGALFLLRPPPTPSLLSLRSWVYLLLTTPPLLSSIPVASRCATPDSVLVAAPLGASSIPLSPPTPLLLFPILRARLPLPMPTLLSLTPQSCCRAISASVVRAVPLGASSLPLPPPTPPSLSSIPWAYIYPPTPPLLFLFSRTCRHADANSVAISNPSACCLFLFFRKNLQ